MEGRQMGILCLNKTFEDPAFNLALDEALLEKAEQGLQPAILRIWEPESPMVVLGRSSPYELEVNQEFCKARKIPVLRRSSGGQSIVTGPGCLMYCLLVSYESQPHTRALDQAHQYVMRQIQDALGKRNIETVFQGTCDLTYHGKKFSGNSLRCKRDHFIYHGTLLYDFPLELISGCLGQPARQPEYRENRSHQEFVTNLPATRDELVDVLTTAFRATNSSSEWHEKLTTDLAHQKYRLAHWTKTGKLKP